MAASSSTLLDRHRLAPGRDRQDRRPPLRHHPRRSAAQFHQRRADRPRQLCRDRRLGISRACAAPTSRTGSRSRCRRSMPAAARRAGAWRPGRAAGQQPRHPPHRRAGHPARLRQRPLGPARHHPHGPGADLTAYARADAYHSRRSGRDPGRYLSRQEWLAVPRDRRAGGGPQMAAGRPLVGRHPAADPARPAGA